MAAVGQLNEKNVKPLVLDETALEAGIGVKSTDTVAVEFNYLKGADGIDELADGKPIAQNIKYGEARAYSPTSTIPTSSPL